MSSSRSSAKQSDAHGPAEELRPLGALPSWLLGPLQPEVVAGVLQRVVPEFVSGALVLRGVKIKRMTLKEDAGGRWAGTYNLSVEEPGTAKCSVALRGTLAPPHLRPSGADTASVSGAFGSDGWRCALPELGLQLEPEPAETHLVAMPQLTEAEQARALLERGIQSSSPAYADLRIAACEPDMISYKPGSRATLLYHLSYAPDVRGGRDWPATVIAKTYRKDSKGRNAYDGMVALWRSPLVANPGVAIAEPLAYIPELKIMVQRTIPSDRSLEDMLKSALSADTPAAFEELDHYMRRAAAGLAALHRSGVFHGETVGLDERFAELRDLIARLLVPVPELAGVAEPVLARLEALAAAQPPDSAVPTHGTFHPEQVLINGERVGLIDFDDFCVAEPAMDVGLFCATIKDNGLNALDAGQAHSRDLRLARLARLDAICAVFLEEYERHAPISRARVALWEGWSYLRAALHFWTKVKPAEPDNGLLMLESCLRNLGLSGAATGGGKLSKRVGAPNYRYHALAGMLSANVWIDDLAEILERVQTWL